MGIVARQSIFSTGLLYAGAIIGYVNILYLFPRFLGTSEIGTVRTVQDMAALFVPFAQFGLTHGLIRFFPKLALEEDHRPGFLTLILLLGILGYLVFIGLFFLFQEPIANYFSDQAAEILPWFPLVLGITFLLLIYNLLTAYCQSLLNIVAPNFIKDILFRLGTAVVLLAYFSGYLDFEGLMRSFLAVYGLMTLSMIFFLTGRGQMTFSLNFSFLKKGFLKELIVFALFSLMGTSGMLIIGKIDSLMVTGMLGTGLNGVYTTVFYIAVVIELPKRAMNQISLPLVSRSFQENNIDAIHKLYKQTSINQLIAGSLLLIGIWINLESIFALMPNGDQFVAGKWVVIIIGLGRMFDMASGINSEIIVMSRYYRFNMVLLSLLAVLMVVFNLFLIPRYGINGAAFGSGAALVLFNLAKFIFIRRKFGINPWSSRTFSVLLIAAVSLVVTLNLPRFDHILVDIITRSGIAVSLFTTGILIFKPSQEVDMLLRKWFRKGSR